ncbi:hypothetical protein [Candidatus Sororendozoicomonas aggregata]|uniref:hypothetical protein n=1 Tax=Candidatus Sororendozoicomonas aggregata TaxID=3073239 RepID=UPI002ED4E3B9
MMNEVKTSVIKTTGLVAMSFLARKTRLNAHDVLLLFIKSSDEITTFASLYRVTKYKGVSCHSMVEAQGSGYCQHFFSDWLSPASAVKK